jgi:hypothetical protein
METDHGKAEYGDQLDLACPGFPISQISTLSHWEKVKAEGSRRSICPHPSLLPEGEGKNHLYEESSSIIPTDVSVFTAVCIPTLSLPLLLTGRPRHR